MNEDLTPDELMDKIRQYVAENYCLTTEVSASGRLFERAVGLGIEVVQTADNIYTFHLN